MEDLVPGALEYAKLEPYLERSEVPKGPYLLRYGDPSNDLYFIQSGHVTVLMELEGGETIRIRKMGAGTVGGTGPVFKPGPHGLGGRRGTFRRLSPLK